MKKRFTDEQIVRFSREAESRDEPVKDLCKHCLNDRQQLRVRSGVPPRFQRSNMNRVVDPTIAITPRITREHFATSDPISD
ncbi:hypothetical protein LGM89_26815 [Burkholderia sp. AU31624]|uniref:hypothetical protein n=1 Tax=Burkholderia sp. AU31624 TaxID=2879629 RepID=UPI001CF20548|nr:hypothetical protein [Burkholderia sp. AU31624]MCA8256893.1 hypothetical protein [Burkholderia sp. AU31624]